MCTDCEEMKGLSRLYHAAFSTARRLQKEIAALFPPLKVELTLEQLYKPFIVQPNYAGIMYTRRVL
jgi:hypothetical protein